jgi:hypothetical protein
MGLLAFVYKNGSDCTNGGLTSKADKICVVNVDGPFNPNDETPAFKLVTHAGCAVLKPVDDNGNEIKDGIGPMMGGNYASTSDSRFSRAVEKLLGHNFYGAVPVHDRFETQEQYNSLSI